jgi:hypothetical protein
LIVQTTSRQAPRRPERWSASSAPRRPSAILRSLTGGGPAGNEQLTAVTGVILLVLFAVIGISILRIGQLISVHLFVGLLLLGPVVLKMASTGYRFVRYYTGNGVYVEKGPPVLPMRVIAPMLVALTFVVFISGIVLMFEGPSHRGGLLLIHKASFIGWIAFFGLHVLGHLTKLLGGSLRAARKRGVEGLRSPGEAGRIISLIGALVGGLVLAIALIPDFAVWTAHGAIHHH